MFANINNGNAVYRVHFCKRGLNSTCLIHKNCDYCSLTTSDVNDAEPRLLVFDDEPKLSFSEKKRARAEPRL